MPRAKYDENNPYNLLFTEIGYFKVNYTDFLYDFRYIYQDILSFYGDYLEEYETEIKRKIKELNKAKVKPAFKNRVYIITDLVQPVLAITDVDEPVFDNLVNSHDIRLQYFSSKIPEKLFLSFNITMYLFKDEEMIQVHSLNTFQLAQFMAVFKNENIVNYQGARDCWYAAPRRNAKKKL